MYFRSTVRPGQAVCGCLLDSHGHKLRLATSVLSLRAADIHVGVLSVQR